MHHDMDPYKWKNQYSGKMTSPKTNMDTQDDGP